jgi:hypothetical protein
MHDSRLDERKGVDRFPGAIEGFPDLRSDGGDLQVSWMQSRPAGSDARATRVIGLSEPRGGQ